MKRLVTKKFLMKAGMWISLLIFLLVAFFRPMYTVWCVGPEAVDVVVGHGKQLVIYKTYLMGEDIGIFPMLHQVFEGEQPPTLEEDVHCFDLSDPSSPARTLRGVLDASVVGLSGNVYIQSANRRAGETYEKAFSDMSGVTSSYFRITNAGFVRVSGAELSRLNSALESGSIVQLNGYSGSPPKGSGWALPGFKYAEPPPNGVGTSTSTVIIPSVGGGTVAYELRDVADYAHYGGGQTLDLRKVGGIGPRKIIYSDPPQRLVSRATYFAYLRRG